jgi:hypothetical protein
LVVTDYGTKYVWVAAIPDKKAQTVAEKLFFEFFPIFGLCDKIMSDLGMEFQNAILRHLTSLFEIKMITGVAYKASTNGLN